MLPVMNLICGYSCADEMPHLWVEINKLIFKDQFQGVAKIVAAYTMDSRDLKYFEASCAMYFEFGLSEKERQSLLSNLRRQVEKVENQDMDINDALNVLYAEYVAKYEDLQQLTVRRWQNMLRKNNKLI